MTLTLFLLLTYALPYESSGMTAQQFIGQYIPFRIETAEVRTTAYFTPVPQQRNYKALVKLNGRGKKTSTGATPQIPTKTTLGTIAAGPDTPFGTIMFVPDYGLGVVEDRGGAIKGKRRLDLYCGKGEKAYQEAKEWGVQNQKIVKIIWENKKRSI